MHVYVVMRGADISADPTDIFVTVCTTPQVAGEEAASWLGEDDEDTDGYIPDLVNAAQDGDSSLFEANDSTRWVRILKEEVFDH